MPRTTFTAGLWDLEIGTFILGSPYFKCRLMHIVCSLFIIGIIKETEFYNVYRFRANFISGVKQFMQ